MPVRSSMDHEVVTAAFYEELEKIAFFKKTLQGARKWGGEFMKNYRKAQGRTAVMKKLVHPKHRGLGFLRNPAAAMRARHTAMGAVRTAEGLPGVSPTTLTGGWGKVTG